MCLSERLRNDPVARKVNLAAFVDAAVRRYEQARRRQRDAEHRDEEASDSISERRDRPS